MVSSGADISVLVRNSPCSVIESLHSTRNCRSIRLKRSVAIVGPGIVQVRACSSSVIGFISSTNSNLSVLKKVPMFGSSIWCGESQGGRSSYLAATSR